MKDMGSNQEYTKDYTEIMKGSYVHPSLAVGKPKIDMLFWHWERKRSFRNLNINTKLSPKTYKIGPFHSG